MVAIPPLVPAGAEFAFAQSPFRTRGTLYLGTQSFFETHLSGGAAEFYADIEEEELRAFISQRFVPSGRYDVMPVPALIAYEARALRMGLGDYLRHRTRWQAQRDIKGIHRWILKLASPAMVATRLPKIMTQTFDFASAKAQKEADTEVRVTLTGIPAMLDEWFHNALGVYTDTALGLAGAQKVSTEMLTSRRTGAQAGVDLHEIVLGIRWK